MFKNESNLHSNQETTEIPIMVMKVPEEAQPSYTSGNTADMTEENNIKERQAYTINPLTPNKTSLHTYLQLLEWKWLIQPYASSLVIVRRVLWRSQKSSCSCCTFSRRKKKEKKK